MFFDIGLNKSNQLPTGAIAEIEKKRDENKFFFKLTYQVNFFVIKRKIK